MPESLTAADLCPTLLACFCRKVHQGAPVSLASVLEEARERRMPYDGGPPGPPLVFIKFY